jgi:hypothetical protein
MYSIHHSRASYIKFAQRNKVTKLSAIGYVIFKSISLGIIAYGVIGNTSLSDFTRAIIVAAVSGVLGIAAVAVGALINSHTLREIQKIQHETKDKVNSIADKQDTDEHWDGKTERRQSVTPIRTNPDRMAD